MAKKISKYNVKYGRGGGVIQITLRDERGARLGSWKANISDKKHLNFIGRTLKDKYDIDLTPEIGNDFFSY